MTDTRDKLNEAEYFLEQMVKNVSERNLFRYNLSAFLASARSIRDLMNKDYKKISGFKTWKAAKENEFQSKKETKYLDEQRNQTVHVRAIKPAGHVIIDLTESISLNSSIPKPTVYLAGTAKPIEEQSARNERSEKNLSDNPIVTWEWYFSDFREKQVLVLCQEYIDEHKKLIEECESLFPAHA